MKVVQVLFGKFHHFHLARALARHGELEAIYTGYSRFKLGNESIDFERIKTYPWFVVPLMAHNRMHRRMQIPVMRRWLEWQSQETIDKYASRTLPNCDVVVGLSASSLNTGRKAQKRGNKYVCDRGSTHILCQEAILREEHKRWGIHWEGIDPRVIEKQLAEYETADLITVPSEFTYKTFLAQGVPAKKLAKIPYGANTALFSPQATPDPNKFVVLYVGQVSIRKGVPYLLKAFQDLKHPRKELWIVGTVDPSMSNLLHRLLPEGVKLLGRIPNRELALLYSRAHAFVIASIEEGLAMVQGEALACGCPVIATHNSGAADLFTDGIEGFIIPACDPLALTDRLTALAENSVCRQTMSHAAIARVSRLGGWDSYGSVFRKVLHNLTNSASQPDLPPAASAYIS